MFDKDRLQEILVEYKRDFIDSRWEEEKYKWEAVQYFQDHWDIQAENFADILSDSLSHTGNLLTSARNFPAGMIIEFAQAAPEEVRSMFQHLFNEADDVYKRMEAFKKHAEDLLIQYGHGAKQHYQYEKSISVYLWLRFPDAYYIYKFQELKAVSKELDSNYLFKRGQYEQNIRNFVQLYREMQTVLQQDEELRNLLQSHLTDSCYSDPELCTLTGDVAFYIHGHYGKKGKLSSETNQLNNFSKGGGISDIEKDWFPADYTPGFSVEDWVKLLHNSSVFNENSLAVMKRMKDYGGMATCRQLAEKYGDTANFYNTGSSSLAKRIARETNCPLLEKDTENSKWWPILYVGKYADKKTDGIYIWKLRDELSQALDRIDLSQIPLYAGSKKEELQYWWLTANPKIWSFSDLAAGDRQNYTLYNENGHKRRIFQNFLDVREGDPVIGYESTPEKKITALAVIRQASDGQHISIEKTEALGQPISYEDVKNVPELADMEMFQNGQGSLFRLTGAEYDTLMDMIREMNPKNVMASVPAYGKEDLQKEVYLSDADCGSLMSLLQHKMNLILQGPPGVGKTFTAKRLAYTVMGKKDQSHIQEIQFHQNYSYEEFIMGYRPGGAGFELQEGVFYQFCRKAADHPDEKYFFIIDEINRGNMSKIFGEMLMLIEKQYRGHKISLAGDGRSFFVPKNLYIIGMMNTADRSLAVLDYALRRRFAFFTMEPAFQSVQFKEYQKNLNSPLLDRIIAEIEELNRDIGDDPSLGKEFCIGHSYFCSQTECSPAWVEEVIRYDILPTLDEYWFDEPEKKEKWEKRLCGLIHHEE